MMKKSKEQQRGKTANKKAEPSSDLKKKNIKVAPINRDFQQE